MHPLFMTYMSHGGHPGHGGRRGSGREGWTGRSPGTPPWASAWRGAPFAGFGFPFGNPRARAARGDVRAAVLLLLAEQPRHGYDIITEIVERSEGRWQPSPGSVYPVLKRLAAEGLVRAETDGERRVFELTDQGRRFVDENADDLGEPWADIGTPPEATLEMLDAARQAAGALWQVAQSGTPEQISAATDVLAQVKRDVYRILAGDALDDESSDPFVREAMAEGEESEQDEDAATDER